MAGDEPAAERGQPGDRLVLAQAREQRVRIGLQLRERGGRADQNASSRAVAGVIRPGNARAA